jgi:hypothetical protein
MSFQLPPYYPHRRNKNGTFDSICLKCFGTVAANKTEDELAELDKRHVCSDSILSNRANRASLSSSR